MNPERLQGAVRSTEEILFFLELHGCSACGSHDIGEPRLDSGRWEWEVDGQPGVMEWRSSIIYYVTCPQCGHQRAVHYYVSPDYHSPFRPYKALHLGGPTPSEIISPHEFAAELVRIAELFSTDVALPVERRPDVLLIPRAQECATELLKFFPPGALEIPIQYFRTPEALAAREAHYARFVLGTVEGWQLRFASIRSRVWAQLAAEREAREAAGIVTAPTRIPLPGLSESAVKAHEQWLDDKGGQRLEARDVEASERNLSTRNLTGAIIENCTLDRANLSYSRLHGAKLTKVRLREANLDMAMLAGTTLTRCNFAGATMVITNLGDAEIVECDFSNANLDRTRWYRSKVTGCNFVGSRMPSAALDKAVFTDCDFRGVDLSDRGYSSCTSMDVAFVRCDLRDTQWLDRDAFRARFVDCKLAGVTGRPNLTEAVFERPDLSRAGDGSQLGTWRDVLALWEIDPDHPRANLTWRQCHILTLAEYEIAKPQLAGMGARVEHEAVNGDRVWVTVRELIDDPAGPKLDALLAAHRASIPKPPPTERELRDTALAQQIIDDSMDQGLSFEDTIFALLKQGFTREEALTALTRPNAAR